MRSSRIIAVDFDGTLCENKYPNIGEPNDLLLGYLKHCREKYSDKLILWTCRVGEKLDEAIEWCILHGLIFDTVNENLPEIIKKFGGDNRKIYADIYLDDKSIRPKELTVDAEFFIEEKIFKIDPKRDSSDFLNITIDIDKEKKNVFT